MSDKRIKFITELMFLKEKSPCINGVQLVKYDDVVRILYRVFPVEDTDKEN